MGQPSTSHHLPNIFKIAHKGEGMILGRTDMLEINFRAVLCHPECPPVCREVRIHLWQRNPMHRLTSQTPASALAAEPEGWGPARKAEAVIHTNLFQNSDGNTKPAGPGNGFVYASPRSLFWSLAQCGSVSVSQKLSVILMLCSVLNNLMLQTLVCYHGNDNGTNAGLWLSSRRKGILNKLRYVQ